MPRLWGVDIVAAMAQPPIKLSDNEADDRLKRAMTVLGDEPGETVAANTALEAARKALRLISIALISSGVKRDGL